MSIRVLIVEDEALLAMNYQVGLENTSCEVIGMAYTGEEAIAQARDFRPSVILMDIMLPGKMSGIDAGIIIKEELQIPIIYITGNSDERIKERALRTAPLRYLEKPIDVDTLCQTIQQSLPATNGSY